VRACARARARVSVELKTHIDGRLVGYRSTVLYSSTQNTVKQRVLKDKTVSVQR